MGIYSLEDLRATAPESMRSFSDDRLVEAYGQRFGKSFEETSAYFGIKPRGLVSEMGRQVVGGYYDTKKMVGQGLQYTGMAPEYGKELAAEAENDAQNYNPDMRDRGLLSQALVAGARGLAPVLSTAPLALIPGVGTAAAAGAAATLFGTSSAQETYDKLIGQGISEQDASAAARRVGFTQGPLEGLATYTGVRAARGLAPLVGMGGTTAGVAQRLTDTAITKPFLKGYGINAAVQTGTEVAQDVGSELIERSYGATPEDLGGIAKQSALGGFGLSLLLGPLSFGSHASRSKRAAALNDALYGESTTPEQKLQARQFIVDEAQKQGVPASDAEAWFQRQSVEDAASMEQLKQEEDSVIEAGKESPLADISYALTDPEYAQRITDEDRAQLIQLVGNAQQSDIAEEDRDAAVTQANTILGRYLVSEFDENQEQDLTQPTLIQRQPALLGGNTQVESNVLQDLTAGDAPPAAGREMARAPTPVEGVDGIGQVYPGVFEAAPTMQQVETRPQSLEAPQQVSPPPGVQSTVAPAAPVAAGPFSAQQNVIKTPKAKQAKAQGQKAAAAPVVAELEQKAPPSWPKDISGAIKEENEVAAVLKAVEAENDNVDKLFSQVAGSTKKAPGRPSMPTLVYAAIRNAVIHPTAAVMVRKPKSITKDVAATAQYGEKVKQIASAARDFAAAYETYASQNLVRTGAKEGDVIGRGQTADSVISNRAGAMEKAAGAVQQALAKLGEAVDGNAKDVEAVVRFVKDRAQKERSGNQTFERADILLSRAWAAAKNESFIGTPDLLATNPNEVRQSREASAKGKTPQLVDAATIGYATFGKGPVETGLPGILNYIRTTGTPLEKTLALAIKRAITGKREIKVALVKDGKGQYDPKTNTITLSETSSREVALHEALHSALQWYVYSNPTSQLVTDLKASLKRVVNFDSTKLPPKAASVQDVLKKVLSGKSKTAELDAVLELVSYGNTLNDFRRALESMESTAPRTFIQFANDTMELIYALVRRMLGSTQSVASDVMENTFKLLEQARAAEQQGPKKGNVLQSSVDTATSAFNKWFGNSVVKNEDGSAKVLFHGTNADIEAFDLSHPDRKDTGWLGTGVYLTDSDFVAEEYADRKVRRGGGNKVIMPLYAKLEKPYYATIADKDRIRKGGRQAADAFAAELKGKGNDGVILEYEGGGTEYVVFSTTGVKSSIGNNGNYDPTSGNILKAEIASIDLPPSPGAVRTVSADLTGLNKRFIPNALSSQWLFDAMGWGKRVPQLADKLGAFAKEVAKDNPGIGRVASYISSRFNLAAPVSKFLDNFKLDKNIGYQQAEMLVGYIETRTDEEKKALLSYLDGNKSALAGMKGARNLAAVADDMQAWVKEYINELSPADKAFFNMSGSKFSEQLIFADKDGKVVSSRLGQRDISKLLSRQVHRTPSIDGFKEWLTTDASGDVVLDAPLYAVMGTNPQDPASAKILTGFISVDNYNTTGTPQNQNGAQFVVDTDALWVFDKFTDGNYTLVSNLTARQKLDKGRTADVMNALRNTVAVLANNYASKRFSTGMAAYGYEDGKPTNLAVAFDSLQDIEAAGLPVPRADAVLNLSSAMAKSGDIASLNRRPGSWVRLPAGARYGDLAEKYIPGSVWAAMSDMIDRSPVVQIKAYNDFMRYFKKAKTVFNPGTHLTNIATNVTLATMHDITAKSISRAASIYIRAEINPDSLSQTDYDILRAFRNSGALLGDYSSAEVKEAIYSAWKENTVEDGSVLRRLKSFSAYEKAKSNKLLAVATKLGKKVDAIASETYAAEDNVFRLAAFMTKLAEMQAVNPKAGEVQANILSAGAFAKYAFLDYDIDSKAVRILRQSFMPFVSWTYAIMPVIGRIAIEKPWKLANIMMAYYLIDAAMAGGAGDDDEETRKAAPSFMREKMFGVGPNMHIRIPFMGDSENPVYYKLGDYVPLASGIRGGEQGFLGMKWWPSMFTPSGPLTSALAVGLMGTDPFTGKPIHKPTDSDWERMLTVGKGFYDMVTPPALSSRNWGKAMDTFINEKTNAVGKEASAMYLARIFGLKAYDYNVQESLMFQGLEVKKIEREFKAAMSKAKREELRNGTPDYEALDATLDDLRDRMQKAVIEARGEKE